MRKGSFSMQLKNFSQEALERHERLRRAVVIKLFNSVILDTPVDTGRLRSNWRCSVASPNYHVKEEVDPSGAGAQKEVEENVGDGLGKDIKNYLTNNLPYVWPIEFEGHSKKSPQGMVRRNVTRIEANLKKHLEGKS